jgi:hypothetical protein
MIAWPQISEVKKTVLLIWVKIGTKDEANCRIRSCIGERLLDVRHRPRM